MLPQQKLLSATLAMLILIIMDLLLGLEVQKDFQYISTTVYQIYLKPSRVLLLGLRLGILFQIIPNFLAYVIGVNFGGF